jgi:hypothetical protein
LDNPITGKSETEISEAKYIWSLFEKKKFYFKIILFFKWPARGFYATACSQGKEETTPRRSFPLWVFPVFAGNGRG